MNPDQMPPMGSEPKKGGTGALIGSIIVILILVLGALYFWGGSLEQDGAASTGSDTISDIDTEFDELPVINVDEELSGLENVQ